jgi:hypothetical protein
VKRKNHAGGLEAGWPKKAPTFPDSIIVVALCASFVFSVPCYENDSIIASQRSFSFFGRDSLTCLKKES